MPRYLNTDNGQIVDVAHHEALIYEDASNFTRVDDSPVAAEKASSPSPKVATAVKAPAKKTTKKKV